MRRSGQMIKAVINLSATEKGKDKFEKTICDFYADLVGKKLISYNFSKEQRIHILHLLMDGLARESGKQ